MYTVKDGCNRRPGRLFNFRLPRGGVSEKISIEVLNSEISSTYIDSSLPSRGLCHSSNIIVDIRILIQGNCVAIVSRLALL